MWCILEADRKAFFIFGRKLKYRRKWKSIYGRNETKTKIDIHFRPKNENESHVIILVFFFFSYIQSPSQPYNAPPKPRPVSPLGGNCWRDSTFHVCSVYNLCGIFLEDISTREQFAFLVHCYRVKAIFHCALLASVWPNKIVPLLNTLSTEADVHGAQEVLWSRSFLVDFYCQVFTCLLYPGQI